MLELALLPLALSSHPAIVAPQPSPAAFDAKEAGRQLTAQFFGGDIDAVWERFGPKMREAMGSKDALAAFQAQTAKQLGTEAELLDEVVTPLMSHSVYLRTIKTVRWPAPVGITWSFDDQGRVAGFYVAPKKQVAESRFLAYQTKAPLQLPFKGAWTVVWGGRTLEQNYHAMARDQRFALDLLVVKDGRTHSGDGRRNEQYYAYNQPILAPAAGTVVAALDGVPDNVPGEMNAASPPGNHVVIDHGHGEFSLLAHLKPGSLKVKVGQKVKAGALLGLCGNSGNSSEAHLHYHLQNAPGYGQGEGLPAQFRAYKVDGKPVERGELLQGQVAQP